MFFNYISAATIPPTHLSPFNLKLETLTCNLQGTDGAPNPDKSGFLPRSPFRRQNYCFFLTYASRGCNLFAFGIHSSLCAVVENTAKRTSSNSPFKGENSSLPLREGQGGSFKGELERVLRGREGLFGEILTLTFSIHLHISKKSSTFAASF